MGPLALKDAEFWDAPRRTAPALIDQFIEQGFVGVVIDGPARVPLGARATLPLAGLDAAALDGSTPDLRRAAIITAARLDANDVRVARAFAQSPALPDDDLSWPGGQAFEAFQVDLRERLGVPWRPSTWLVTFLLRDRPTNRVRVTLEGGAGGFKDPAAAAFLTANQRPRYPQPISPPLAAGEPYRARRDSPPVPDQPGIALSVERLVKDGDDAQVVLRGSFRLPVLEREVVKPADPADAAALEKLDEAARAQGLRDGVAWQDPGDAEATAVIPITIVATGVKRAGPLVVHLQVPSYDAIDPTADVAIVTGHFALDLLAVRGGELLRDQTSFIYALSGEALAGPATVAVVDPRLVG